MILDFKNKYVAFIDVLGFTSIVNSNNHDKIESYFDTIKMAFQIFDLDKAKIQKLIISDSIILIAEDSEEDLRVLLTAIQSLQKYLALSNIWVRGGVAFGEVFNSKEENIIVGKGYIKAFLLENEAIYPRVIIDPSILSKLKLNLREFYVKFNGENKTPNRTNLIHDYLNNNRITPDDAIFVCYAHRIIMDSLDTGKAYEETGIKQVYDRIKLNLYGPQQHYHKYLWLKKYFNDCICEVSSTFLNHKRQDWFNQAIIDFGAL